MSDYKLEIKNPIPLVLLIPNIKKVNGVNKKKYPTVEEALSQKDKENNSVNLFFRKFQNLWRNRENSKWYIFHRRYCKH